VRLPVDYLDSVVAYRTVVVTSLSVMSPTESKKNHSQHQPLTAACFQSTLDTVTRPAV